MTRGADILRRATASVTAAIAEQALSVNQIADATDSIRQQADHTSRALKDQARAMKDMTGAVQNVTRQVAQMTRANRDHSSAVSSLVTSIGEVREITERNASGVKRTRTSTDDLLRRAEALTNLATRTAPPRARARSGRQNGL